MKHHDVLEYLEEKFPQDPQTGALTVRLRFRGYSELFEPLDGSPWGKKSLSSGLIQALFQIFEEIPLQHPYALVFEFPQSCRDSFMEERCREDFSRWCRYRSALAKETIAKNMRETLLYAFFAILLIGLSVVAEKQYPSTLLGGDLLDQILTVGWWIFAWQAGSNLLLHMGHIRDPLRQFARLRKYPPRFEYFREDTSCDGTSRF